MSTRYNNDIYLTTKDLNDIENNIYELTNEIQENIFNNQQSLLRNIQVGDNLNNKTVYLSFPKNIYESISGNENKFIKTDNNNYFNFYVNNYTEFNLYNIVMSLNQERYLLYRMEDQPLKVLIGRNKIKLPYNFGTVTEIDTNNNVYQYIKIYDDETIIPNYIKHTWVDNEFLTMQKIDNIENGIKNIGYYYYTPVGWLPNKTWIVGLGINSKNISYNDLNRWINNLNLINFDDIENLTIWNSDVTQLDWNKNSNIEWEDL